MADYAVVLYCPPRPFFERRVGELFKIAGIESIAFKGDNGDFLGWQHVRDTISVYIPSPGHAQYVLDSFDNLGFVWIAELVSKSLIVGCHE